MDGKKTYTRIGPRRRRLVSIDSVWMGPDHLLLLESTRIFETYTRYYYRDIKGIFVSHNQQRAIINGILGFLTGAAAIILMVSQAGLVGYAVVGGIALALAAWNTLPGRACKVYLVTGVQTVRLHSLHRHHATAKALAKLQQAVLAAQADLLPKPAESPGLA